MDRTPIVAVAFAVAMLAARPARGGDEVTGRALFDDGRRLMDEGKYAEACPKFEEGMRVFPGIGMKYDLADCYERTGKLASAWGAFLDAAALAHVQNQPERERACRRRAVALEPDLSRIIIVVAPVADVPGLEVQRDGTTVGRGQWSTGIPADPGEHLVSATATGRKPWEQKVSFGSDSSTERVAIPLLAIDPASKVKAPPVPVVEVPTSERLTSTGRTLRVAGATSMVAGAVGVGLGVAFGLLTLQRVGASSSHCWYNKATTLSDCDDVGYSLRGDAMTFGDVSTWGFAIGGTLAVAGLVLILLAPTERLRPAWHASASGLTIAF